MRERERERENVTPNKSRSSNLELLRILSMFMIIAHHYAYHGGFILSDSVLTMNKIIVQFLSLGGKIGVICFILITGYFMISSTFKFKKLLKLILEVLVYSIGIMLIFYLLGFAELNLKDLVRCILPISHSLYWFVTTYVVLYILSPFINKFIGACSQKEHLAVLAVLLLLSSLLPTFLLGSLGIGNVGLFILFYIIAAYIRLYPGSMKGVFNNMNSALILTVSSFGLLFISVIVFDIMGLIIPIFSQHATYFMNLSSPLAILCAVSLFLLFKNLQIGENKFINRIALSMFGVYLIHDNLFVRTLLWNQIFQNTSYFDSAFLLLHAFIAITITFVVCVVIDQIRIICIEKPVFLLIDRIENRFAVAFLRLKQSLSGIVSKYLL